jgi:hypothetical protein
VKDDVSYIFFFGVGSQHQRADESATLLGSGKSVRVGCLELSRVSILNLKT